MSFLVGYGGGNPRSVTICIGFTGYRHINERGDRAGSGDVSSSLRFLSDNSLVVLDRSTNALRLRSVTVRDVLRSTWHPDRGGRDPVCDDVCWNKMIPLQQWRIYTSGAGGSCLLSEQLSFPNNEAHSAYIAEWLHAESTAPYAKRWVVGWRMPCSPPVGRCARRIGPPSDSKQGRLSRGRSC